MRLERLRTSLLQKIQTIDENIEFFQDRGDLDQMSQLSRQRDHLIADENGQREYAAMLLQIGNGIVVDSSQLYLCKCDATKYSKTYNYRFEKCFIVEDSTLQMKESVSEFGILSQQKKREALKYFYPHGFQSYGMNKKTILAATNKQVDDWNKIIQQMNPNFGSDSAERDVTSRFLRKCQTYSSADKLNAVDDPNDIISQMLTDEMLNKFEHEKAPPHKLTLCIGDICYLLRTLGRQTK